MALFLSLCRKHLMDVGVKIIPALYYSTLGISKIYESSPIKSKHLLTPEAISLQNGLDKLTALAGKTALFHHHTLCKPSYCIQHKSSNELATNYKQLRCKSTKKKNVDTRNDSDSDGDDHLDEDDFEAPAQFKVQTIHSPSLRIDAVLSKALGLSRHRLEEIFLGSSILLNGKKVLKKGAKMDVDDYVDVVMDKLDGQLRVKRVKLLKINSEKTNTEKFILRTRIWKAPFLIDDPDQWKPDS